jgi:NAD(P)-dependent dehydrogenase (short-subunit alcohol dehydrogenase family)
MKKIVIAGGSGYLGEYLLKNLNGKFHLISLSKKKSKNTDKNYICNFLNVKNLKKNLIEIKKSFLNLHCIIFVIGDSKKKKNDYQCKINSNFYTFKNLLECYCEVYKFYPVKIIVISSIVTEKIIVDAPIEYSIGKCLLKQYALYKAKEFSRIKININLISPGNILIEGNNWSKKLKKDKKKTTNYIKSNVPIGKFINPEIILKTCELLINDKNNCYTGANFIIDGGQTL